ncbi:MFS transporter [Thiomicrospira microaerophila]|uniref:MFS transporter n=1 Tax=Thiomicrospira microaerophila TaxID=406020 RepID=UPI00200CF60D|nr:MFS transporter [Thiomicrospira microaerophila]UQB41869.1 MFS transporter [Thiomicrospira microaerophila]
MSEVLSRRMNPLERRATFSIAGIFSTRMLGLFMIFPVFALFAEQEFSNITGLQIGLAIGAYGLTQALLQIPYGMLSDRFGRKPLILVGLFVFLIGSIICALADSIEMMILGRAVQGAGAVAAVLTASVSDLVREPYRLRAMSIVGITIGLSFTLSLVAGPLLAEFIGVRGIFWVIAGLSVLGMVLVIYAVPEITNQQFQREAQAVPSQLAEVLKNGQLLRLDIGVFILHAILTAMFIAVPFILRDEAGMDSLSHWEIYLPVMLLSFVLMVPLIIQAESKGRMKQIFAGAILMIALAQIGMSQFHSSYVWLFFWLLLFFTAFNVLEASLPSLVVKLSPADKKGTASGVYSSSQFMGAAVGGAIGGLCYQHYGYDGVFAFTVISGLIWFALAVTMQKPNPWSIASVTIGQVNPNEIDYLQNKLCEYEGVFEAVVIPDEQKAYFKIDRKLVNEEALIDYFQKAKARE